MKGDFSRFTFDPRKSYSKVLLQQGRLLLDADWNEMVDVYRHDLRNTMRDLIGPYGGPIDYCGFRITGSAARTIQKLLHAGKSRLRKGDFFIGEGRYYVDGIACENARETTYYTQPDYPAKPLRKGVYLVYLDVWERHITYLEDREIREAALGGPDTTTRMKVVWQVKVHGLPRNTTCAAIQRSWRDLTRKWRPKNRGMLRAVAEPDSGIIPAGGGYSGTENRLYRVEIHKGGRLAKKPTFKWSRDNGTVACIINGINANASNGTTTVTLDKSTQGSSFSLQEKDWVEVLDEKCVLEARPGSLHRIKAIGEAYSQLTLQGLCDDSICRDQSRLCLLRRWDQKESKESQLLDGAVAIQEGTDDSGWIDLENGIRIRFDTGAKYCTGDYWLIPARAMTGSIEWPLSSGDPVAIPPIGIDHHFAPLSIIRIDSLGKTSVKDCRSAFRLESQRPPATRRKR